VEVSARVDYALRSLAELAHYSAQGDTRLITCERLATDLSIPAKFLESILRTLRQAGIVTSQRGVEGGFRLAKDPAEVSVADVIRALEGPLAAVRGAPPEDAPYGGHSEHLRDVWVATRAALRDILEHVTLANIVSGEMPPQVLAQLQTPGAWKRR
jgi:Rrf2 family protein